MLGNKIYYIWFGPFEVKDMLVPNTVEVKEWLRGKVRRTALTFKVKYVERFYKHSIDYHNVVPMPKEYIRNHPEAIRSIHDKSRNIWYTRHSLTRTLDKAFQYIT